MILIVSGPSIMVAGTADATLEPTHDLSNGEEIFQQACFSCHGTGFHGAPVIGETYDWEARLDKGEPELLKSTLEGMNGMPARGGCAACSDSDIQQAVRYLIESSTTKSNP